MPRYDYRCTSCDHDYEVTRSIGESGDESCPRCDSPAKRIFSPVGVVFKGSGFHNTDYRTRSTSAADTPSSDAPAASPACGSNCSSCPAADA